MSKIKKGDNIVVISGKYKGLKTKVIEVLVEKKRVRLEGIHNIRHLKERATKKTRSGGRIEIAASVPISKVMLYSEGAGKGVRPKIKVLESGKKARFCPKSGQSLEK